MHPRSVLTGLSVCRFSKDKVCERTFCTIAVTNNTLDMQSEFWDDEATVHCTTKNWFQWMNMEATIRWMQEVSSELTQYD